MGRVVFLKGKSRHGKNRIKQHGEHWQVIDRTSSGVLHIQSIECRCPECTKLGSQDWRWISETDDPNFEIVLKVRVLE